MISLARPLTSKLSRRFFLTLLGIVVVTFGIIYLFSVPLIKQKVFEIEQYASRLALNNVVEVANRMYQNVEEYQEQALSNHQQQLKVAVSLTESYIKNRFQTAIKNKQNMASVRKQIFADVRALSYGNNDYIWIADHSGVMLSHPDPRFHGQDIQNSEENGGVAVLSDILQQAIKEGEGFYQYKWNRLSQAEVLDKVSYVKNYPEWGFVIGSGVYLDDLSNTVKKRKEQALLDLRAALAEIKIAKTGYLFVFDSNKKMLIHPNPNIDGSAINTLINPLSNQFIADDLMAVADTGHELHYLWDKPSDPDNYVYEKLSLVRYLPGFDWYICSSIYLDELSSSSETLSNRLLTLAALTSFASLLLAFFFVQRITRPLERLAQTAQKVQNGDLTAQSHIHSDDEVGILASSFDGMVKRLKNNFETLDSQVKQRSDELLDANAKVQRMNAVGQLTGGLAHDFNNLLSIILGNLLLIRDRPHSPEALQKLVTPAIRASRRGADITHRLLAFSRKQSLQPTPTLIDQLLSETCQLLSSSLPASIELEYTPELPNIFVHVDSAHLESVLINLALNAKDAMPDGGLLSFTAETETVDAPSNDYDEEVPAGTYVRIEVKDTGRGFSEKALQKAFEPFYTTKTGPNNSGLGLSMVYGFVKQSQGYISIISTLQKGSTIKLLLPMAKDADATSLAIANAPAVAEKREGELALLVEDNDDVRHVVREQLISLGFSVLEAADADEARKLMNLDLKIDVLISDIMLESAEEGILLAMQFREKYPYHAILLISGNTFNLKDEKFHLLKKPFDQKELYLALMQAQQEANQ